MSVNIKRLIAALAFFLWTAFVIVAYYGTQKPALLAGFDGLATTGWVLIVWIVLVINAAGVGSLGPLRTKPPDSDGFDRRRRL